MKPDFLHFEDLAYFSRGVSYYAIADGRLFWGNDPDKEQSVKLASIRSIESASDSNIDDTEFWGEIMLAVDDLAQPRRTFQIWSREAGDEFAERVHIAIDRQRVAR